MRPHRVWPLCDWWPTFSAMQVAFIGKPTINFNLRLVGGDITAFPFVEKLLTNLIKNVLVNLMVWPNVSTSDHQRRGRPLRQQQRHHPHHRQTRGNLPNMDLMKSAAKMRPAIELVIRDGNYDKPKIVRAPGRARERPRVRADLRRPRPRHPRLHGGFLRRGHRDAV